MGSTRHPARDPRSRPSSADVTEKAGSIVTSPYDFEQHRHMPGFADYERGVLDRIDREHTSGLAIASLVLGIVWFAGIGAFMAVVFGHVALSHMKTDRLLRGRGMAVAGLVLGYVGLVGAALLYMLVTLTPTPAFQPGTGHYPLVIE